mgnify:CR=1 FL=1
MSVQHSQQVRDAFQHVFNRIDANGDEMISGAELQQHLASLNPPIQTSAAEIKEILKRFSSSAASITFDSFFELMAKNMQVCRCFYKEHGVCCLVHFVVVFLVSGLALVLGLGLFLVLALGFRCLLFPLLCSTKLEFSQSTDLSSFRLLARSRLPASVQPFALNSHQHFNSVSHLSRGRLVGCTFELTQL